MDQTTTNQEVANMKTIRYEWTDYDAIAKVGFTERQRNQHGVTERHTTKYEVDYRDVFTPKAAHMPALIGIHTAKELNPWTLATMGPKQWNNYLVREITKAASRGK